MNWTLGRKCLGLKSTLDSGCSKRAGEKVLNASISAGSKYNHLKRRGLQADHPVMASPRDLCQPLRLMTLRTSDFDYPLPEALIASHPPERREDARMLVVHRAEGRWEHRRIADLPEYIRPGDLAVFNDTRVIPARVYSDDGRLELLLLEAEGPATWRCLVKPGRKLRVGA